VEHEKQIYRKDGTVFAEPDLLQTKQKTWVEIGDHVIL
jgi:hypothetical protein